MPSVIQRLLIVENEASSAWAIKHSLRDEAYEVLIANDRSEAVMHLNLLPCDVLLLGPSLTSSGCKELLMLARQQQPDCVSIVLLNEASMSSAVEALNDGEAFRLLSSPWSEVELRMTLHQAFELTHHQGT